MNGLLIVCFIACATLFIASLTVLFGVDEWFDDDEWEDW